jgi:hypothetical protein
VVTSSILANQGDLAEVSLVGLVPIGPLHSGPPRSVGSLYTTENPTLLSSSYLYTLHSIIKFTLS